MSLHMLQMRLDRNSFDSWLRGVGIDRSDIGYQAHSLLRAAFGQSGPQPFCVTVDRVGLSVLGYGPENGETLRRIMREVAEPAAAEAIPLIASKEMPSEWVVGSRFRFELRACPISRHGNAERDLYQPRTRCGAEPEAARGEVYAQWLRGKLDGAAELKAVELSAFSKDIVTRRRSGPATERALSGFLLPNALFKGVIEVNDGSRFSELIAAGIGRHKAFGFGMLLLRPVRTT